MNPLPSNRGFAQRGLVISLLLLGLAGGLLLRASRIQRLFAAAHRQRAAAAAVERDHQLYFDLRDAARRGDLPAVRALLDAAGDHVDPNTLRISLEDAAWQGDERI